MPGALRLSAPIHLHSSSERFCPHHWSVAILDTQREESTSEIPREAGLATWGAGSPSPGTSCPVIVLAPVGAGVPVARLLLQSPRAPAGLLLRARWAGLAWPGRERRWWGRGRPRGRSPRPLGDPSPVCPEAAPRPATSETRLSPTYRGPSPGETGHGPPQGPGSTPQQDCVGPGEGGDALPRSELGKGHWKEALVRRLCCVGLEAD